METSTTPKTLSKILVQYFVMFFISIGTLVVTFFPYIVSIRTEIINTDAGAIMSTVAGVVLFPLLLHLYFTIHDSNNSEEI